MKKLLSKIHLWLSVPFGLFITLICFSGAMLVFEKEITEICCHDLYFVKKVGNSPLPIDRLMKKVGTALPDSVSITGVTVSPEPERAYQVSLSRPRRSSVYVDQYTGEIKGRSERLPFYDTMFHMHRWLLGDSQTKDGGMSVGKLIVGISTLMLIVILVTGILMWLTNRKKMLRKSLTVSFTKGWPRFLHDIHVAGGIYSTVFLLALALTGLTWSFSWYRTGFYSMFGVEANIGREHGDGGHKSRSEGGRHANKPGHANRFGQMQDEQNRNKKAGKDTVDKVFTTRVKAETGRHGIRKHHGANSEFDINEQHDVSDFSEKKNPESNEITDAGRRNRHDNDEYEGRRGGRHRHDGEGGRMKHYGHDSTLRAEEKRMPDSIDRHDFTNEKVIGHNDENHTKGKSLAKAAVKHVHEGRDGRGENILPKKRNIRDKKKECYAGCDSINHGSEETVEKEQHGYSMFAYWQNVYERLAKSNPGFRQITVSDGSATVVPEGRASLRACDKFEFDTQTGMITGGKTYKEQDKSVKVRGGIYMLHVGSWGGMFTRIITFLAALIGATLPLTGYYLWIRRLLLKRKKKSCKA